MRAKIINEAKIRPNRELFDQFKEIFKDVLESGTNDPFTELNDRLNPLNIFLIDFQSHLDNLSPEERKNVESAILIPPMGIRLMGYDPPSGQLFMAVDKSFDDKVISMSQSELNLHLDRMWSAFGHETIHMGQVSRMKVQQNPDFHSPGEYYGNKQEIMAMAFSFVEEMSDHHSKKEILNKIRTNKNHYWAGHHPLLRTYRDLGGKAYKLFLKYVYQYLQKDEISEAENIFRPKSGEEMVDIINKGEGMYEFLNQKIGIWSSHIVSNIKVKGDDLIIEVDDDGEYGITIELKFIINLKMGEYEWESNGSSMDEEYNDFYYSNSDAGKIVSYYENPIVFVNELNSILIDIVNDELMEAEADLEFNNNLDI